MARGATLLRQWELLKTLQAHRYGLSVDELAERLECARRTIQRDLGVLRTVLPLRHERRELGRRYWMLEPHVLESEKLQLSVTEMLSLYLGQQLLAPLAGTPLGDGLATAIQKIKAVLPTAALLYFEELDEGFLIKTLGRHDYSGQARQIGLLNDAILNRRVIRVTYHSASQDRRLTAEFHPYGMVLLSASLYCIGYLAEYEEVRTLKVSRLEDVQTTERRFEKPASFSLARHTRGAFGVYDAGDGQAHRYRVRFTGWAAVNVRENRWHPSQEVLSDGPRGLTAQFALTSTVEFKRWLLGFGPRAVVLRPASFRREVLKELQAAADEYSARPPGARR